MTCFQFIKKFLLFDCTTADRKRGKLIVAGFVQFCGNIVPGLPLLAVVEIFVKVDDYLIVQIDTVWVYGEYICRSTVSRFKDLGNIAAACDCCVQLLRLLCERMRFAEKLQSHNKKHGKQQYIQ